MSNANQSPQQRTTVTTTTTSGTNVNQSIGQIQNHPNAINYTFPPPLPQYYAHTPNTYQTPLQHTHNSYQTPLQHTHNSYQTPTQHTQNSYQTPTQLANKPVVIPVNLTRSNSLKNKDKHFLLALQKRYPLTSRYSRIQFNINLYEEVDSDDESIELLIENKKESRNTTHKENSNTDNKAPNKNKNNKIIQPMEHTDDTIKKVMKWIFINDKLDRTKLRLKTRVDDKISLDIFTTFFEDIIYTTNKIYKFKDGIFCGTKVEVNGKCVSPHIKADWPIKNERIKRIYKEIVNEVNEKRINKVKEWAEIEKKKASEKKKKKNKNRTRKNKDNDNDN
eukprot:538590_1